ncbi:MAG: 50S ribosomal protein L9 [Candidatus Omnitrophica bacterium]|nr:50S ribosomal protein L9 [Candidatus Omnitrophota bacterium]
MEVILSQEVDKLGRAGDVVKVKDGYARNYLLPRNLAFIASPGNLKRIELQEKKRRSLYEEEKKQAEELAAQLAKASCTVSVEVNDLDKLYGSITETDIAKSLEVEGFNIDKKQIQIENPIEELGIFEVKVKLHPDVTTTIRLWVTKK